VVTTFCLPLFWFSFLIPLQDSQGMICVNVLMLCAEILSSRQGRHNVSWITHGQVRSLMGRKGVPGIAPWIVILQSLQAKRFHKRTGQPCSVSLVLQSEQQVHQTNNNAINKELTEMGQRCSSVQGTE
jgi:hypothetical protein